VDLGNAEFKIILAKKQTKLVYIKVIIKLEELLSKMTFTYEVAENK